MPNISQFAIPLQEDGFSLDTLEWICGGDIQGDSWPRLIYPFVYLTAIKGNGNYTVYYTIQHVGTGPYCQGEKITRAAAVGVTDLYFAFPPIIFGEADNIRFYVLGTPSDNDDSAHVWVGMYEHNVDVDSGFQMVSDDLDFITECLTVEQGHVEDDTPSSIVFKTDLAETGSYLCTVLFLDGALNHQTGWGEYDWDTENNVGIITMIGSGFTDAPASGDFFLLLPLTKQEMDIHDVLASQLADTVAMDGEMPTLSQAVYEILQFLTEKSITGTTMTVNKPDGTTVLMHFTLDSATSPTSITRDEPS